MPRAIDYETMPARKYGKLTPGKALRRLRELHEMTQTELARRSGVPQSAISGIENETINVGTDRARKLAKVLHVHPATIAFADVT
jgi:transcriptional regulator with XRE-family HTH domain